LNQSLRVLADPTVGVWVFGQHPRNGSTRVGPPPKRPCFLFS